MVVGAGVLASLKIEITRRARGPVLLLPHNHIYNRIDQTNKLFGDGYG